MKAFFMPLREAIVAHPPVKAKNMTVTTVRMDVATVRTVVTVVRTVATNG